MILAAPPSQPSRRGSAASVTTCVWRAWIICAVLLATLSSWIAPPAMAMAMMGLPATKAAAPEHLHRHATGSATEHHVLDDAPVPCSATGCIAMGCGFATLDQPVLSAVRIVWTRVIQAPPTDEIGRGLSVSPPLRPPRQV